MDVPQYSSAEIMKKQLLMAIHLCDAVDGDGSSSGDYSERYQGSVKINEEDNDEGEFEQWTYQENLKPSHRTQ